MPESLNHTNLTGLLPLVSFKLGNLAQQITESEKKKIFHEFYRWLLTVQCQLMAAQVPEWWRAAFHLCGPTGVWKMVHKKFKF